MKYKFKLWVYTPIDVRVAEAELNSMARDGYVFLGIGGFPKNVAVYGKSNTAKRKRYTVDYYNDESKEEKEERKTFFKEAGWNFIYDGNDNLSIYVTEETRNKEIYSDADTRLEGIEETITLGKNTSKALRGCFYRIVAAITYALSAWQFQEKWMLIWAIVVQSLIIIGIISGDIYKIIRLRRIKKNHEALGAELSKTQKVFNQISAMTAIGIMVFFILWAIALTLRDGNTMGDQIAGVISVILLGSVPVMGIADVLFFCFERTRNSSKLQMTVEILIVAAIVLAGILMMFCIF